MSKTGRRDFLKTMGLGALAASLPATIEQALAIPANNRTGTIEDVEHIVILMQENRSFDHYFGTLRGVRGFGDPRAVTLATGKPVWYQPSASGEVLPFRPNVTDLGKTFLPDPPHDWNTTHAAWNGGNHDQWIPNKGVATMTYHTRRDLSFHFALADAFTICDAYHCSVLGPTDPNRYHMWTGWVGNDGSGGGPVIDNSELGYGWSTYPEVLERAGISWKVYQDIGFGLDGPHYWGWTDDAYIGNYGDNSLLYFFQYQNAVAGTALADKAKTGTNILANNRDPRRLLDIFSEDVSQGRLPQVSWVVAPEAYSEHPNWEPDFGAWYVSQFLNVLVSSPETWSKTALFVVYDEEGGFFDHQVPPTPPRSNPEGLSTVATTNELFPGNKFYSAGPYGLGMRVPLIVVSPWTKGGWVNSETFDHTSLIRFIETRFANSYPGLVTESNITPWRRAVVGDLTSAFDFTQPNNGRITLPDTDSFIPTNLVRYPDYNVVAPSNQLLPAQEPGVRPARALPYELDAHGVIDSSGSTFRIDFTNTGRATAVFQVRSGSAALNPRTYTVEPNKSVSDSWGLGLIGLPACDLSVYGPNGFLRSFKGTVSGLRRGQLDIVTNYDQQRGEIILVMTNPSTQPINVFILDNYKSKVSTFAIKPGATVADPISVNDLFGWYDLTVSVDSDPTIQYHFAGHLENGKDSISDPAIGTQH